jgi:hypothetical protein
MLYLPTVPQETVFDYQTGKAMFFPDPDRHRSGYFDSGPKLVTIILTKMIK